MSYSLGIDLGGSKIYAVVKNRDGEVVGRAKTATKRGADPKPVVTAMRETAETALAAAGLKIDDVEHIGAAVPSSIDPDTGDCHFAPNLGWRNFSLRQSFQREFNHPVFLENDVNSGTYAEYAVGAGKGFNSVVGYFIGTGLGGGVILNGELVSGVGGCAGELGHAIVEYGGRTCGCGHKGCVEAYCSKVAFVKEIKRRIKEKGEKSVLAKHLGPGMDNIKSKWLAEALRAGDETTRKVLRRGMRRLGAAAASVGAVLSPECFILGGGVMESMGEDLLPWFMDGFERHLFALDPNKVSIELSALGDDAVALGAALLAEKRAS